ncbi:MAG: hypothetical protein ACTSQW_10645, partial [Promethearchaeota archaeon]
INEYNKDNNENYILTQPHNGNYLSNCWGSNMDEVVNGSKKYSINIIRENSKLSLEKKIQIYKNFESIIDGGSVFTFKGNNLSMNELMTQLSLSKINMFQFNNGVMKD